MADLTTEDMDYEARLCGTNFVKLEASIVLASVREAYKETVVVALFLAVDVSKPNTYFHSLVTPWSCFSNACPWDVRLDALHLS